MDASLIPVVIDDSGKPPPSLRFAGYLAYIVEQPSVGQLSEPQPLVRDWTILRDIIARLQTTGEFDDILVSDSPDLKGVRADRLAIAIVSPGSGDETETTDDQINDQIERRVKWSLEIRVRHADPQKRDERCEYLLNVARAALDYRELAGGTLPEWTRITQDRYEKPNPPERSLTATGEFTYLIDGPHHRDLTHPRLGD